MGTLCTITEHHHLDDGRIAVLCVAGPRVVVTSRRHEAITNSSESPPLLHVTCDFAEDYQPDDTHAVAATGRECVDLIEQLASNVNQDLIGATTALPAMPPLFDATVGSAPPLFSPERLSFFLAILLARYEVLADRDRLAMLYSLCTSTRLERIANLMQATIALEKLRTDPPSK